MYYLLDTHAVIWYFEDSVKMPVMIARLIDDPFNKKFISVASLWEISIKLSTGKLDIQLSFDALLDAIESSELSIMPIKNNYLKRLSTMPFIHKDPFDRLIIATSKIEDMVIVTIDENIQKYDIQWIW